MFNFDMSNGELSGRNRLCPASSPLLPRGQPTHTGRRKVGILMWVRFFIDAERLPHTEKLLALSALEKSGSFTAAIGRIIRDSRQRLVVMFNRWPYDSEITPELIAATTRVEIERTNVSPTEAYPAVYAREGVTAQVEQTVQGAQAVHYIHVSGPNWDSTWKFHEALVAGEYNRTSAQRRRL